MILKKQMLTYYMSKPVFEVNGKIRCVSTRLQWINVHPESAHTFVLLCMEVMSGFVNSDLGNIFFVKNYQRR